MVIIQSQKCSSVIQGSNRQSAKQQHIETACLHRVPMSHHISLHQAQPKGDTAHKTGATGETDWTRGPACPTCLHVYDRLPDSVPSLVLVQLRCYPPCVLLPSYTTRVLVLLILRYHCSSQVSDRIRPTQVPFARRICRNQSRG